MDARWERLKVNLNEAQDLLRHPPNAIDSPGLLSVMAPANLWHYNRGRLDGVTMALEMMYFTEKGD